MLTNEQLKNISPVGLVNPAPELTNIVIPNTFEEKFGDLLNRPMPKPIAIAMPDVSPKSENYMGMRLQGLAGRVINDLSKKDPNFNNPVKRVITTPLSEMEPYLKYDSNYDSKIGAAFGQAGKGIVVGGLAGTTTAPGIGTAIGAATLGTAGFLSGLLAPSGRGVYIPGSDNRKRMLKEQEGFWSTMGGFTNNLIDRAFEAGVGGTAALLSSPIGAFSGKDFHEWGSNPLTERLAQGKEQSEYKRHLSDSYLAKNPIAKFFTPEGFQNEFADMAGFTLGMMVGVKGQGLLNKAGGSLVSSALSGTELAANITARNGNLIGQLLPTLGKQASKMFTQGVKAERIGLATTESTFSELGLMNNAKNLIKDGPAKVFNDYGLKLKNAIKDPAFGLGALSAFERTTLASYGEGRVEAAQAFKDIYQEAIKRGFTEGEAQQMATSGANKTLFGNLAILGITNQFGLNQLMKPSAFKNLAKWFTKDWVIDNTSKTLFKNMLVAIGKNAATGAVVEGLFEELGQYAVSEAAKNQQFNMADLNNPVHKAFFSEFIDAYKEGFKTDEGISNLFGGAMFGALMGAFGMEGATGMFFERKEAAKLNIPPSIKTSITEMTKAANFIAQHSAPFNGQLFTSYSEDEDGNLVPDANGTIRMSDDPTRLFQLTKALSHIVTLSKDQANTLLTSVVNKLDSTNPKDKAAFNSIKDYLEQYGDEGKVSLEQYINQNLSPEEKYNTLRLIDALSRQEQGIREEQLNQLALELTKSNYVYDFVANGVEDRLFDEIDQLERSLSTSDTAAQKDQIEFFGKLYQKSNFNEAKKDLEEFRKSLSDQVTLYNSLANRYSQPFTTLALKNKEGKTIRIPVQVDMKQVFRSALIQKNYEYALKRIVEDRSKAEAELLSEPGYKEEYFKTDNTSEDVIEAAKKFKEKSKSAQELNLLDMLEKHYLNSLKDENKNFADLTDREKLIKEAKKAEEVHNNFVESTPTLTDKNVNPVPPTTSIQDNETEDNGEEDEPPVTDTESQTEDVEQPVEEVPTEEQPVAQQPEDEAPTNEPPIQNEEPPFTEEPPVTNDSKKEPKENKQPEEVKKTEEQPPNEPPVDIDEGDVVEDDYANGAKTPFSAENIFKTYAADVVNGRFVGDMEKVKFLNNMNGASGTISLLAIPVKSKLGKTILSKSDNDRDFYKNYIPANPELIYLFVKRGSVITTSDKLIPLTDLFKMTEDQMPPLMFDKSTTFRKEKDGWRVGHKLNHITEKFSQLENYTEEEINIIVRAYNDEMRQLEQDAMDFLEGKHNDISRLSREISGLTPGMEHSFDPANPLKLREIEDNPRLDIELPTQERAKLDGLKVGSPYVKYTTQEGKVKYFRTKRTKLSDQQVNVVSDIMIKYLKNETLSPDEIAYLYTVVNWFGSSLYENNATSRNAVGVADNTIVFNPHSVNAFSWSLSDPISALNNRLREYYHFVNNSTLTKAKNTQYKDLVTGTVYNNYQDYLIKTKALLFYAGKNVDAPIKSNIQVIFKPRVTPNVENKTPQRKAIVSITELLKNKDNFLPDSIQTQILNSIDSITFKPSEGNPMIHKGSFEVEVPVIIASSIIEAGVAEGQVVTLTNKSKAPITANVLKNYSMVNIPESAAADPNSPAQRVVISLFKDTSTSPVVTYLSVESPLQKEEKKKEETETPKENNPSSNDIDTTSEVQDYNEDLDEDEFPNRSIFGYEEIEEIEDIDSFKAWLQNVLPQFSVVTEEGFIDNKAQGQLFKNLIRIYKGAGAGTGYHEAFEAVWAYMLSPKEKEAMLKEFKSRPGSFEYYSNKQKIKYSEATDYQAKEMLAEGMIDFMKNRKLQDASPKANNFFMKLWNMLVDFINSIRSFFGSEEKGFKTIEEVYDALNAGKFSTYKITEFDATANRDRFETSSLINYADVARFESLLHDRFITDVLEENDRFNIFALLEDAESSKEKLSSFLNKKLSKIIDVFAQDYLDNIKKNPRLINSLISYSNIKDPSTYDFIKNKVTGKSVLEELRQRYVDNFIKTSKLSEFLNIEEFEETEKDSKEGIVAANEINPSANVNNVVRFLLGNLYYLDNLGRKVYHEDDVFGDMIMYKKIHPNKAQKELRDLLANTVDYVSNGRHISFKEVVTKKLEKAADLHPNNSWMVDLVNKLKLNTDPSLLSEDDFKLQISFLNSFKKAEHVPVNMIVSENGLFLRNAILDSNAYSMKETWTAVLKKEAVQNDNINPQTNNPILLPPVTKYKKGYDFVTQYLKLDIGKPSQEKEVLCGKLQDILYNGALEIDDFFMKKANSTWNDLSLLIAKEGNMKEKSFRNHNNRQQFAVTNPTATSDVFNRANSVEYLNEFVQSNKPFLDEKGKVKVGIKRNLFVTQSPNNPIFRLNTRSRVKHYLLNGATDLTKGSGKSFAKMSFHEKLIFKANAYFKEKVFSMPINSDKSMENAVSFVDNDGKGRALIPESMFPTITSSKNLGSYAKIIDAFYIPALIDELELLLDSNAKEISFFGKALDNKQLGYFQNIINFTKKDFDYLEKNPSKVEEFAKSKVAVIDKYLADQVLRTYSEMGSANLMKYLDPNIVFNMLDDRQRGAIHDYVQAILSDVGNSDFSSNEFVLNKQGITYGSPEAVLGRIPHLSKQDKEWKENRQRRALQFLIANPVFRKDLSRLNKKEPGSKKVNYFDARIQQRLIDEIADENLVLNIVNGFEIMNFNLVRSFTLNYQVFNMNVQNLIYGSPLMYKQDEFAKRASAFASAKQPVENSVETNEKLDAISPRFDNKKRDGKMRQVSYDDPIVVSSDLISIAEGAYLSYGRLNPSMTKEQKENIIGATFDKKGKFVKIKEGLKNTIIEAYTDLKIADAQAMMMPDAIFDLMFKSGKATKSFLKQFRYQMAYERYQRSLIPKQSKMAFARYIYKDKVLEKQDLAIIKKGQPDGVIQVLKPQGSGYLDGYNSVVPVFLKNSVLPLFWSRVENNPELAKRYIDWQKNQIDLIGFHSGQKIGNVTRNGKLIKLYDHTGKTLSELPPIQEMDATYFGLQVETPNKYKNKVNRGVQITKLITSNLTSLYGKKGHENITELVDSYYENLNALWTKGEEDLHKKLGIKYNITTDAYEIKDINHLIETLKGEVRRLDLPISVEDLFNIDPTDKKLAYSFDVSTERNRIEYILNSILDSTLIHQKVKGTQSPQISSVFERIATSSQGSVYLSKGVYVKTPDDITKLTPEEQKSIKLVSTDLRIRKDGTIEVYLPSYLRGISDVNDKKIDKRLLDLIGYRIPTQSLGQVEKIRVMGFLDQSYGDAIVVPSEIVGKAGSDFDIDKLTLYFPNYYIDKKGNLKYYEYSSDPDKVKDRYNQYIKSKEYDYFKEVVRQLKEDQDKKFVELGLKGAKVDGEIPWTKLSYNKLPDAVKKVFRDINEKIDEDFATRKAVGFEKGVTKTVAFMEEAMDLLWEHEEDLIDNTGVSYEMFNEETGEMEEVIYGEELIPIFKKMIKEYEAALEKYGVVAEDLDVLKQNLAAFRQLKDENQDYIKSGLITDITSKFGLISFDDFSQLSTSEQNSREALENRNIEIMSKIISLPENRLQHIAPNSAATIKAVDLDLNKQDKENHTFLSEVVESTKMRHTLLDAKNLVGVGALNVTGHSIAQLSEMVINTPEYLPDWTRKELFNLDKNNPYGLNKIFDEKGVLISSNLSEFLSAFVDAAKDPFAVRLNLNFKTINEAMLLVRLGLSIEKTLWFLNQDTIRDFVYNLSLEDSTIKKASNDVVSRKTALVNTIEKYMTEIEPTIFENFDVLYPNIYVRREAMLKMTRDFLNSKKVNAFYTADNLKMGIDTKGSKNQYNGTLIAIKALLDFEKMKDLASELSQVNSILNIESTKTNSFLGNQLLLEKYLKNQALEKPLIGNVKKAFEITHLKPVLNYRMSFRKYLKPFLRITQGPLSDVLNKAAETLSKEYKSGQAKLEILDKFTNFVLSHMLNKNYSKEEIEELLIVGGNNLNTRISNLKQNYKKYYKDFGKPFDNLGTIFTTVDGKRYENIKINITKEDTTLRNVEILKYENLYKKASTPSGNIKKQERREFYAEAKAIIEDLVKVSIHQSGTFSSSTSLSTTLPAEIYSRTVTDIFDKMPDPENFDILWEQFHQNFWSDRSVVPVYKKDFINDDDGPVKKLKGALRQKYVLVYKTEEKDIDEMDFEDSFFDQVKVNPYLLKVVGAPQEAFDENNKKYIFTPVVILPRLGNRSSTGKVSYGIETYDKPLTMEDVPRYHSSDVVYEYTDDQVSNFLSNFTPKQDDPQSDTIDVDFTEVDNEQKSISSNPLDTDVITSALIALVNTDTQSDIALKAAKDYLGFTTEEDEKLTIEEVLSESALNLEGLNALLEYIKTKIC